MPKRFTDTEIWDKEWFMSLQPRMKCFVKYVRDKCDLAGIWHPNYMLASVMIGENVTEQELLNVDDGNQFTKLQDGKVFCIGFVEFQYGNTLNPASPVHKKVLSVLEKHQVKASDLMNKGNIEIIDATIERKKFNAPSKQEVYDEMLTKIDKQSAIQQSDKFMNYYESNGWMVGKNRMKSWKASVAGWISRMQEKPATQSTQSTIDDIQKRLQQIGNKKYSDN
jgi:hypothetical protein